jgi:hypothetical protein
LFDRSGKTTVFMVLVLLIILAFSALINVKVGFCVSPSDYPGAPDFTGADPNVSGLYYDSEAAQRTTLNYPNYTVWSLRYIKGQESSGPYFWVSLSIFYVYDVSGGNSVFNSKISSVIVHSTDFPKHPQWYVVSENVQSTNYYSVVYQDLQYATKNFECDRVLNGADNDYSGDPHIVIAFVGEGNSLTSANEMIAAMETLTQHAIVIIANAPRYGSTPTFTPTLTPTPTPTEIPPAPTTRSGQDNEKFTINYHHGNVQVKFEGETNWVQLNDDMVLYPGDEIKTTTPENSFPGDFSYVELHHSGMENFNDRNILMAYESGMRLKHSPTAAELDITDLILYNNQFGGAAADFIFEDNAIIGKQLLSDTSIVTPDSIITTKGTQFEVIINQTGTIVRTFSGIVEITDLNEENSVSVGANQTCTVPSKGIPGTAVYFNEATVDKWWVSILNHQSSTGFNLLNQLLYIIPIVAIVIVVIALAVVFRRRRSGHLYLPPPPPPPQ